MAFRTTGKAMGKGRVLAIIIAVLLLLATVAGAGMNEDLMDAADEGNLPKVKQLLAAGADVNAKTNEGFTALEFAAVKGHLDVVELLRKAGAK